MTTKTKTGNSINSKQLIRQLGREVRTSVLVVSLLVGVYGVLSWLMSQAGTYSARLQ